MTTHLKHGRRLSIASRGRCRKAYLDRLQGLPAPTVAELALSLRCDPGTVRYWMQRSSPWMAPGPQPGGRHRVLLPVQLDRIHYYRALGASVAIIVRAVNTDLPDTPVTGHQVRRLKREEQWPDLRPRKQRPAIRTFDPVRPGYIHFDTIVGQTPRDPVIFTAKERASGMCFAEASEKKTAAEACDFLFRVLAACPLAVHTILTDNGSEFAREYASLAAEILGLRHRHTRPRRPQTNGVVERFNGVLKDALVKSDPFWWYHPSDRPTDRDRIHLERFKTPMPNRTVRRMQAALDRWTTWMNLVRPDAGRAWQTPRDWLMGLARDERLGRQRRRQAPPPATETVLPDCIRRPIASMVSELQLHRMLEGLGGHRFLLTPPKNWSPDAGLTGDH
jgi:hypothetical protein